MSEPRTDIDLEGFAREARTVPPPRARWRRFVLPVFILAGFGAVLVWSVGDVFLPRIDVTVSRPRLAERTASAGKAASAAIAFQAAGWVEPDPFPRHVVPLTGGTVAEILVQESDRVKRGDVVARLVTEDAKLELDQAKAAVRRAEADRNRSRTELQFAREEYAAAIAVKEQLAVMRSELAGRRAESERLAEVSRRAQADVRVAEEELAVQRHLAARGAAGPRQVELAAAKVESARATQASAAADATRAVTAIAVAEAKLDSAKTRHELRIDDRRAVALAETGLAVTDARVVEAESALARAQLRFDRTDVKSPWDGVVLERLTLPGASVGGQGFGQGLEHAAICSIYDPESLRVRVDVALADIGKVVVGQAASIRCEARRERGYAGQVVRIVQRADIQKVTLQVHVAVTEPDARLRPEMVCQVRFLDSVRATAADSTGGAARPSSRGSTLLIPARLLRDGEDVWVLDVTTGTAERRRVTPGTRDGEWIEVRSGLNATDKLIDSDGANLEEGARVRVVGKDRRR